LKEFRLRYLSWFLGAVARPTNVKEDLKGPLLRPKQLKIQRQETDEKVFSVQHNTLHFGFDLSVLASYWFKRRVISKISIFVSYILGLIGINVSIIIPNIQHTWTHHKKRCTRCPVDSLGRVCQSPQISKLICQIVVYFGCCDAVKQK